jgi:phosphatidylserine decarboxylase
MNSLELPVWFRPYGFALYAWIFGCNLDELAEPDLTKYASLGDFFYRQLKPGARPIANSILVSPADGTVLHFGSIKDHRMVEQVKGMTYSLDALLGISSGSATPTSEEIHFANTDHQQVDDTEFANVNGIEYSVDELLGHHNRRQMEVDTSQSDSPIPMTPIGQTKDASVGVNGDGASAAGVSMADSVDVALDAGIRPLLHRTLSQSAVQKVKDGNELFFAVVYLAPGDYHRFHSPTAWVVEKRRHFAGELYSVSPYIAKRLANLFVLNERVAMLGRWRHGFFSMVPVGATNVGSIVINFDQVSQISLSFILLLELALTTSSPFVNGRTSAPMNAAAVQHPVFTPKQSIHVLHRFSVVNHSNPVPRLAGSSWGALSSSFLRRLKRSSSPSKLVRRSAWESLWVM